MAPSPLLGRVLLSALVLSVALAAGLTARHIVAAHVVPTYSPSAPVAVFFDGFDRDGSGRLEIAEAARFFDWVEEHVQYRYDDEHAPDAVAGVPVGDGRPGSHFQQTPEETLYERAGDCEDMNALELAFYRHFGVTAYEALVNSAPGGKVDHAVTIVYAGRTREELVALGRSLDHYELGEEHGVPPGFYFIVDNAYSDDFGEISGGIEEGAFTLSKVKTLSEMLASGR